AGTISIMAGRGCPFDCDYCDHSIKGYRPRYRPVASVIEEMETLLDGYGNRIGTFYFWDDILIWDRDWIREFCESLIRRDLRTKWTCNGHVSKVEPRLMSLMKRAGCVNVRFGIESGSQKILDALNKGVRVEKAFESLMVCLEAGLDLTIYTMTGMTGEDRETIGETVDFFRRLIHPLFVHQVRSVCFFMLTPFPGTRIFDRALGHGLVGDMDAFLERGFDAYHDLPLNISGRADRDLIGLKDELERQVTNIIRESKGHLRSLLYDMAEELRK
ncbi:MAG: radical SAM protein, partial [Deltaproteobacteria bacterium]|nr:radical SAM protein [Deltaproteobacteria bacterium]